MKQLLVLLALVFTAEAQLPRVSPSRAGFNPERLEVMHETVQRFVEDGRHAGIITALARNGNLVDIQAYGYRDIENQLPMELDTICRVYSMSKIITSVGVLILFEEGAFNLDDPVGNYLPELRDLKVFTGGTAENPQLEPARTPVTIKHLLTHTSGMMYDFDGNTPLHQLYKEADLWSGPGLDDFIRKVGQLPLKHHPGEAWTYGINDDVLGALIEKVSGQRFGEFLEERIFKPLNMPDTGFDVPEEKRDRLAKTYLHGPDGGFAKAEPLIGVLPEPGQGIEAGGAGIFSTIGDYLRFAQMLLNGGELEGQRILGRKTVELMTANHLLSVPGSNGTFNGSHGFGLGVEIQRELGRGALPGSPGAFGWYGAATTYCRIDPKENLAAIAFVQHFPFNQHKFFSKWATAYYQALE